MKIKLLIMSLIAHATTITPTTKSNLQKQQQQLLQQQAHLLCEKNIRKNNPYPIVELCPTKPPKKYHGSHEKVRLQKSIDTLKAQNDALKTIIVKQ